MSAFQVRDGSPDPLTATASVIFSIIDINDEPPVCVKDVIEVTIGVIATEGSLVTSLDCSDADVTPSFSQQVYSISNSEGKYCTPLCWHNLLQKQWPVTLAAFDQRLEVTSFVHYEAGIAAYVYTVQKPNFLLISHLTYFSTLKLTA